VLLIHGIFRIMAQKFLYILALSLIAQMGLVQTFGQKSSVYEVKRMSFSSVAFSEISPVIYKDGVIFCSNKRFSGFKDRTAFDGHRLYNIYLAERKDTSDWRKPEEIKSVRSSLFNNGPMCFAPDGRTVYFTSEVESGKAALKKYFQNHNGIFIAELSGTDLLGLVPFKYNNMAYDVGQPTISSDGKYLFFASDMPGGQGGSDIYRCELINGEWSSPENLGPSVNSPAAENFPYIHPSGRLFFTSNRPGGIGGLDVYSTSFYSGKWEEPVLLPEPINSKADDFAFVAEDDRQTGYFSSNRRMNDDIYEFESTIIRKALCDSLVENSYCYRFQEENAIKVDTMPFKYNWRFGDGEVAEGVVVEHCYKGPGTYLVQLDVVNLITKEVVYNEKSDTLILEDIVQPYITSPDRTSTGQQIILNADSTNLPGWNIAQYYWNFDDETIAIGKKVDKSFLKPGAYDVQLIVTTGEVPGGTVREACVSKKIIVLPKP